MFGTYAYMAPEVIDKETGYDKNVDWWAVGIMLYQLLIGITPFHSKEKKQTLKKIVRSHIVFPDMKVYKIEYSDLLKDLIV